MESLKLAKEAKEEADDALDDVETAGAGDFFAGTFVAQFASKQDGNMEFLVTRFHKFTVEPLNL